MSDSFTPATPLAVGDEVIIYDWPSERVGPHDELPVLVHRVRTGEWCYTEGVPWRLERWVVEYADGQRREHEIRVDGEAEETDSKRRAVTVLYELLTDDLGDGDPSDAENDIAAWLDDVVAVAVEAIGERLVQVSEATSRTAGKVDGIIDRLNGLSHLNDLASRLNAHHDARFRRIEDNINEIHMRLDDVAQRMVPAPPLRLEPLFEHDDDDDGPDLGDFAGMFERMAGIATRQTLTNAAATLLAPMWVSHPPVGSVAYAEGLTRAVEAARALYLLADEQRGE